MRPLAPAMKLRRLKMRRKFLFGDCADRCCGAGVDAVGRCTAVIAGDRLRRSEGSSQNDKCRARKENCDRLAHEKRAFQDGMTVPFFLTGGRGAAVVYALEQPLSISTDAESTVKTNRFFECGRTATLWSDAGKKKPPVVPAARGTTRLTRSGALRRRRQTGYTAPVVGNGPCRMAGSLRPKSARCRKPATCGLRPAHHRKRRCRA